MFFSREQWNLFLIVIERKDTRGLTNASTEAYFNALTKSCADKIDAKWQAKLEGVGVWTDEHCERMIISLRVD